MKRIKPEELPEVLTEDTIELLVDMVLEFPKTTFDWADISQVLEKRGQLMTVLDRAEQPRRQKEKERIAAMTDEERLEEERKAKEFYANADPYGFYGNMGQPETLQEFKNRYGVHLPGYDKEGNKIV